MKTQTLETLFLDELADMYDSEKHLVEALPRMAAAATHDELREAFQMHLAETEGHVEKLERVFAAFGKPAKARKCPAVRGILKEGDHIISENKKSPTINAALISAGQKVEHYEIASYGCLREWANQLGNPDAADLLAEILEEEKSADHKLTELAQARCNQSAQLENAIGS